MSSPGDCQPPPENDRPASSWFVRLRVVKFTIAIIYSDVVTRRNSLRHDTGERSTRQSKQRVTEGVLQF